ncbi:hypothetical protein [Paenibacillus sp.]|uniref:hypothetical protein n=1 Tax=Paenibacillus sp. TaxID=58172 RepID=UPI002D541CA5|nr:hypothetical protein [Paenibacillus sp.]HZG55994.1 hypothetical protein [Paenibacillus sp.]
MQTKFSAIIAGTYRYRRQALILSIFIGIALVAVLVLGLVQANAEDVTTEYAYQIKRVSDAEQTLRVELNITGIADDSDIVLITRDVAGFDLTCADAGGKQLPFTVGDGYVEIERGQERAVHCSYSVELGKIAKHGHQGILNEYVLAFSGEQAFMLPLQAYAAEEREVRRSIGKISVGFDVKEGWTTIVPFAEGEGAETKTVVERPTTNQLLHLRKSAFAFGNFESIRTPKGEGSFDIYYLADSDKYSKLKPGDETIEGLNRMYDFYRQLFGFDLPRTSLVLLPRGDREGAYTFAGADSLITATTFIDTVKRDWELMGHRLFHSFFDYKVTSSTYRRPPNQWLYEGLATYYENASMSALPGSLKRSLGVDVAESFNALYRQYVYMTLKDASLLNFPPMEEEIIQHSHALTEFLHYTKAPLIVRAIEDRSLERTGERNRMLRAILRYPSGEGLALDAVVHHALGDETNDFANDYLFGRQLLPLWHHVDGSSESEYEVSLELNIIEHVLGSWFRREKQNFPVEEVETEHVTEVAAIAEKEGIHFASAELEQHVREMSPTIYKLLLQYALRAHVAGIDPEDPELRFKLLGDEEAVAKWEAFLRDSGAEPQQKFGHVH